MPSDVEHSGGLLLGEGDSLLSPAPLIGDGDVSWLPHCRLGDNQGADGACAIFTIGSWVEVMRQRSLTDKQCLDLYADTLARLGRPRGSGLTFYEAVAAAVTAGWLPKTAAARKVTGEISFAMAKQPLLAAYEVTPAWDKVSAQGCLKHDEGDKSRGLHAVLLVGTGRINKIDGRCIWVENSWGRCWGWNGLGVMLEKLHIKLCHGVWLVEGA
jgi:hypothetical protein